MGNKEYFILTPIMCKEYNDKGIFTTSVYWVDFATGNVFNFKGHEVESHIKKELFDYINKSRKPIEVPDAPESGWSNLER